MTRGKGREQMGIKPYKYNTRTLSETPGPPPLSYNNTKLLLHVELEGPEGRNFLLHYVIAIAPGVQLTSLRQEGSSRCIFETNQVVSMKLC